MRPPKLFAVWLGTQPYAPVYDLQCRLMELRKADAVDDVVLLLEHEPTITSGRGAHASHLITPAAMLERAGITAITTDRGGDVTLHAPGQLVAYPVVKLEEGRRDVRKYVQGLTDVMRRLIAPFGIGAGPAEGMVGLWTDGDNPAAYVDFPSAKRPLKIGAIGVRLSRWVTMHGFALNVTTDLGLFRHIVPCGISDYGVCSVESLTGQRPSPSDLAQSVLPLLCQQLGREPAGYHELTEGLEASGVEKIEQMLSSGRTIH